MIAGNQCNVVRAAKRLEPRAGGWIFSRQRQVDEIAGDGDVVCRLRVVVGDDARLHFRPMQGFALAAPIHEAGRALADQFGRPRLWQRCEVRIRQVRQQECHQRFF
jgi:hypothetical protein